MNAEITSDLTDRTLRLKREPHRPLTQLQRILPRGSHRSSISILQDDAWFGSLQETQGASYPVESTLLLGMVGGHFDLRASVELPGQEEQLRFPVAAGVAVVYPAEAIAELLEEAASAIDQ